MAVRAPPRPAGAGDVCAQGARLHRVDHRLDRVAVLLKLGRGELAAVAEELALAGLQDSVPFVGERLSYEEAVPDRN